MLNKTPTDLQIAYNLAAAIIIAVDERDYWNDMEDCYGREFTERMNERCSTRIGYAVDIAKKEGLHHEVIEITKTLLEADEWFKLK